MIHPEQALFDTERRLPLIPACDHYAGTEARMLKALARQADAGGSFDVTLDLEDGAPAGREGEHTEMVAGMLTAHAGHPGGIGVRIHDHSHPHWQTDVDMILAAGSAPSYLTIPKPRCARDVAEMVTYIQGVAVKADVKHEIPIHVLIETHGALHEIHDIAGLPWMRALEFGQMDFVSGHQGAIPAEAMRSPGQFDHALVRQAKIAIASAALAHDLVPVHNVTIELDDPGQAGRDAARARAEFGFLRMWSIHPDQVAPILAAFLPAPSEVELAAEVLLAAGEHDWAPIRHAGRLYDRASYRYYWRVLRRAHADGGALPAEAAAAFFA